MAVYNERVKVNTNHVNRSCITNESSRSKKKDLFEADPPQKEGVGVGGGRKLVDPTNSAFSNSDWPSFNKIESTRNGEVKHIAPLE